MKLNLLIITDHITHTDSNSLYHLARAFHHNPRCNEVWVCSRGLHQNTDFFNGLPGAEIYASSVTDTFNFETSGSYFQGTGININRKDIDAILVRMPQPLNPAFLLSLESIIPPQKIMNSPAGIIETSNKAFLLQVADLCPDPILCSTLEEAVQLSKKKEIVLKPRYSYGGRGILRLSAAYCWDGNDRYPISKLSTVFRDVQFPMLALTFLKNVTMGDKRTLVVNRKILGSALRFPAPGSWMCNVAQGGHAMLSEADEDELEIERRLTPMLYPKGIVIYGFDTLVNDDGKRVLSEINTLSIGGLWPMQEMSGRPVLEESAERLLNHLEGISTQG